MKRVFFFSILSGLIVTLNAQQVHPYRASYPITNELVHTKLAVQFDYLKARMPGKAWLTLKPHFYPSDSLRLDAKGMDIHEVALIAGSSKTALRYVYDSLQLYIKLDKIYLGGETYTVYIDYTAKPNEFSAKESEAITGAKGLYFINPTGSAPNKPTQIWTQGATESNSVWMPTIDKPNQKTTQEIYMTVPEKYVTLSNGLLLHQQKNADGTRTDYWKMELPHAPYLFFMGVGDFAVVKDSYKGKEVSYYVEKKYEPVSKKIFGNTPEMMQFFSEKLGMDFPWPKYAQMVGRDYVSGAMENTTATLHQEGAYQNARQLTDGNVWEETIAHELFHQWFGDLVGAESWSNLTLSESMANYSEYLWLEYKKGKDAANEHHFNDMQEYFLQPGNDEKNLVRFSYEEREDMFDAVSYNKGGRILHMLRSYVGDAAFYKALNIYLAGNKFKPVETHQLRLAFEEVTGEDLNWFWNQWYYGYGHPKIRVDYVYSDTVGKLQVIVQQTQKTGILFRLPLDLDIYQGATRDRHRVWIENKTDTFSFSYNRHPDLVNVDADKILLGEKTDTKSAENFIHQMKYAPGYLDRREAIEFFYKKGMAELSMGLEDQYTGLRRLTIEMLGKSKFVNNTAIINAIENIVNIEKDKKTKAAAILFLSKTGNRKYEEIYNRYLNDSSYSVAAACMQGLEKLYPSKAYELAKKYAADIKGDLEAIVTRVIMLQASDNDFDFIAAKFSEQPFDQNKFISLSRFAVYLSKLNEKDNVKKGIDHILQFRNTVPEAYRKYTDSIFKATLDQLAKAKGTEITEYINRFF